MNRRRLLLFLAVGVIAFAAAFVARRAVSPQATAAAAIVLPPPPPPQESAAHFTKAWTTALAEPDSVSRMEAMQAALSAAGGANLPAFAAQHLDDPDTLALILHRWAETDERAAAAWTRQLLREGRVETSLMGGVVEVWAARDPTGLTAWFKEPGNAALQESLLSKLTGALFARDPAAAFALAKDFPLQWHLPPEALSWVLKNPASAAQTLGGLPLNRKSLPLAEKAAAAWAEQDAPAAAAWAAATRQQRGPVAMSLLQNAVRAWSAKDPAAATAFAVTQPLGDLLASVPVQAWMLQDPAATLAWITDQAPPSERLYLVHGAMLAAAGKDPAAAAAFVSQMPDGSLRDKATAAACEAWTKTDPAAAAAWVHSQPDSPGRQDALNQTATAWARKDAASAAAWASATPEGTLPGNAYSSIMDFLRRDRAAAYAWLNELPPDAARAAAPRLVGSTDLAGAHAAFDLPDGPYKPLVLDHVLNRFIRSDTQLAIVQATTFTPDQRALLRSLVEAAEPVPTETYRNSLTGAEKAALLERLR